MRHYLSRTKWAFFSFLILLTPTAIHAQPRPVGVVTALQGKARLTRIDLQTKLQFKEGILLRDIIDTQEKSLTRILFGGKSTVTVRELSRLQVSEEVLPAGTTHVVHELASGAILVHVVRQLMRPGDEVQIRTPNAIAAVRGTTILAQYIPSLSQSVFILLTGAASVTHLGGSTTTLAPLNQISITGTEPFGIQVGSIQSVPPSQIALIMEDFRVDPVYKQEANLQRNAEAQLQIASQLASTMVNGVIPSRELATLSSTTTTSTESLTTTTSTTLTSTTNSLSNLATAATSQLSATTTLAPTSTSLPTLPTTAFSPLSATSTLPPTTTSLPTLPTILPPTTPSLP